MDFNTNTAVPFFLVFLLGAAIGALLNSLYRAAMIEKIETDFQQQLERIAATHATQDSDAKTVEVARAMVEGETSSSRLAG
jgi:hypothetical protein